MYTFRLWYAERPVEFAEPAGHGGARRSPNQSHRLTVVAAKAQAGLERYGIVHQGPAKYPRHACSLLGETSHRGAHPGQHALSRSLRFIAYILRCGASESPSVRSEGLGVA